MGLAAAAGIAAVATVGGAVISSHAASKASKAQQAAADAGIAEEHRQYDQTRADFAPWRDAGGAAIKAGAAMLQPGYNYTASPSYQWRLSQGLGAVQNSAASKGMLMSGGTLKDLNNYAQGAASQDFGDSFNRQMAVAAGGQQANTTLGNLGGQMATNNASLLTQAGNAKASGYIGQANAWSGALQNLGSIGTSFLSDRRAKEDIRRVGKTDGGLDVFTYRYKGSPVVHMGVMAQDVAEHQPHALGPVVHGLMSVNYAEVA